jgi:translation elongation factor EF-1beta
MSESNNFCGKCGASVGFDNNFCPKCGSSVASDTSKERIRQRPKKQKKKGLSKKKKVGIGFGVVVLLFFVLVATSSGGSDSTQTRESKTIDANTNQDVRIQETEEILNLPYTWTGNNFEYKLEFREDTASYQRNVNYDLFVMCTNLQKSSNSAGFQPIFDAKLVTSEGNTWDLLYAKYLNACSGKFDPQESRNYPGTLDPYFSIPNPDEKPELLIVDTIHGKLTFNVKGT